MEILGSIMNYLFGFYLLNLGFKTRNKPHTSTLLELYKTENSYS